MICSGKICRTTFHLFYLCRNFVQKVNIKKYPMDNPTAYFRLHENAIRFQVQFPYIDPSLNVNREFNFDRLLTEPLQNFLDRVKVNVEKLCTKKFNKKMKKIKQQGSEELNVKIELMQGDVPLISNKTCKEVFFDGDNSDLRLRVNNIIYLISINSPWVSAIILPINIMAGFPVFPVKLELLFSHKSNCLFQWFKTKTDKEVLSSDVEWINTGVIGFMFVPSVEDIGCHLKLHCTPSNGELLGPPSVAISTNAVAAGPGPCPFEIRHSFTSEHLKDNEFRVCSYNILSDIYAETEQAFNDLFPYCPRYALSFDYRRQLLIKEIIGYNADILCLQEVDDTAFEHVLNEILTPLGYLGCYSQKGGTVREGVACFYTRNRFNCKFSDTIILGDELQKNSCLSDLWECVRKKDPLRQRVVDRHTALQVLVLESKDNPSEILLIGNTHLYFHPDADHVRLLQAAIIIRYLTNLASVTAENNPDRHVSLLLSGDFNSVPECGIYKLMTTKHVPQDFIDWKSNVEESVEGLELNQPWNFESACGTPKYTNFTVGFADCLDYIFYQTDWIAVKQVVPLPSEDELRLHTAIPSVVSPSDHIALVADLCWVGSNKKL